MVPINDSVVCHRVLDDGLEFKWGYKSPSSIIHHAGLLPDGRLVFSNLTSGNSGDWAGLFTCFDADGDFIWSENYFEEDSGMTSPMLPPAREFASGDIDRDAA